MPNHKHRKTKKF